MKSELYDALIAGLPADLTVREVCGGRSWTAARLSDGGVGAAARFSGSCDFSALAGLPARQAALAALAADQETAGAGLAVINAFYNTAERISALGANVSRETICTDGIGLAGRTVGMVGHMSRTARALEGAARLWIFELDPRPGDLPASEEERLIPECDLVVLTGATLINHTVVRLLELAENAQVVLLGPTVPLCPALLALGVDRLSGLALTRRDDFLRWNSVSAGSPMPYGESFLLKRT